MHGTTSHRIIAALIMLLAACLVQRAAAEFIQADEPGTLFFSVELHAGKRDWLAARLSIKGGYTLYAGPQGMPGTLPGQESRRIFEELEKLIAAGVDLSAPPPPPHPPPPPGADPPAQQGPRTAAASLLYMRASGQHLEIHSPSFPPPLLAFLRTLWHKLQHHHTQSPAAAAAAAPAVVK